MSGRPPTPNAEIVAPSSVDVVVNDDESARPIVVHAERVDNHGSRELAPLEARPRHPLERRALGELADPRLILLVEPDSQRAASFRLLRDNLLSQRTPKTIAVTSALVHEGKTTTAINLALALRERPADRVLLVDANFFAASLAAIFRIDRNTKLAEDLDYPWLAPYHVAEITEGFHVAALLTDDGRPPTFNSRWFETAVSRFEASGYDHIIFDLPALDGSAAVTQVVAMAEGTLLTARAGNVTARDFRRAAERIPRGRALGVTLVDGD